MHSKDKFLSYYYNFIKEVEINNNNYNTIMHNIQETDLSKFENNKLNILICIENCYYWKHYEHYNKFKNFGNKEIQLYFYNHINKIIQTNKYLAIPFIYTRINHYLLNSQIKPSIETPFNKKKFCIFTSNWDYMKIAPILKKFGKCDHIKNFKKRIGNKSLFFSDEILNLLNEYKFVFCSENSFNNGYVTEKIFNSFFSKSIPIYLGPNDTNRYFNKECFINVRDKKNIAKEIKKYINNEHFFYKKINCSKINNNFNNENYIEKVNIFINNIL